VMTESDKALNSDAVFAHEWHKFLVWLRYSCPDFQYIVVEHRQGDHKRRNWHVLSYGSDRLPVKAMREYWLEHYHSTITGMQEVEHINKAIAYLAGYLTKGDKFVRSWCSHGWVFDGWLGYSKRYYRNYFEYPNDRALVMLSKMTSRERELALPELLLHDKIRPAITKSRASPRPLAVPGESLQATLALDE